MSSGNDSEYTVHTAVRILYRYTDKNWGQAFRYIRRHGKAEALIKAESEYRAVSKAERDDFYLETHDDDVPKRNST